MNRRGARSFNRRNYNSQERHEASLSLYHTYYNCQDRREVRHCNIC